MTAGSLRSLNVGKTGAPGEFHHPGLGLGLGLMFRVTVRVRVGLGIGIGLGTGVVKFFGSAGKMCLAQKHFAYAHNMMYTIVNELIAI